MTSPRYFKSALLSGFDTAVPLIVVSVRAITSVVNGVCTAGRGGDRYALVPMQGICPNGWAATACRHPIEEIRGGAEALSSARIPVAPPASALRLIPQSDK